MKTKEQVEAAISNLAIIKKQLETKLDVLNKEPTSSRTMSDAVDNLQLINNHIDILNWIIE